MADRMLGGCAVGLQDLRILRLPPIFYDHHDVDVMCWRSLSTPGKREIIERTMEVDASVLLHIWSLAAAAERRANDQRAICCGYGTTRVLPSREPRLSTQIWWRSILRQHLQSTSTWLRDTERLFICGQSHGPCRTLLAHSGGLTTMSNIATLLQGPPEPPPLHGTATCL